MQDLEAFISILEHVVPIVAVAVGGVWAWFRFIRTREGVWNLEVSIRHEAHSYSNALRLMALYINLKNIGKINIAPGKKGCEVSIVKIPCGYTSGKIIEWNDGNVIVDKYDCIGKRGSDNDRRPFYSIEPGCTYTELMNILVDPGSTLIVQARFWWKDDDDCITEHKTISIG